MARIFRGHSKYEELLMEHLDGRLDEAGEAEFQAHVKSCAACQVELRELGAVRAVLRAQPMVEPPRSFALPLDTPHPARVGEREGRSADAPGGFLRWAGNGSLAVLRSLQMATVAAALVLVALVGLDLSGLTTERESAILFQTQVAEDSDGARHAGPEPEAFISGAPSQQDSGDGSGAPRIALAPDQALPDDIAGSVQVLATPETGRTPLEWARLVLSGLTAVLALGVVALTWVVYRNPV